MSSSINFLPFLVGGLMVAVAIFHEWTWYRRRQTGVRLEGTVVGEASEKQSEDTHAIVEYEHLGRRYRFVSRYGTGNTRVGSQASVIHDLESGTAEHLTLSNRWALTLGPFALGLMFLVAGVSMMRQDNDESSPPIPANSDSDGASL